MIDPKKTVRDLQQKLDNLMYKSKSPLSIFQLVLSWLTASIHPSRYSCIYPHPFHLPIVSARLHVKSIAVHYRRTFSCNHIRPFETEHHHSVQLSHIRVIAYLLLCVLVFQLQTSPNVSLVSPQTPKLTSFDSNPSSNLI